MELSRDELIQENERKARAMLHSTGYKARLLALWGMVAEMVKADNAEAIAEVMKCLPLTRSGRWQEIFAMLLSGGKRDGFFVEFGACNGLAASNTLLLEQRFGWKGILAEPNPFWHAGLRANRTAALDFRCVSATSGDWIELHQSTNQGNSSVNRDHRFLGDVAATVRVETVTLTDLLREHDAPRYIDFLSVDTEGHEPEALGGLDFDRYRFGFICIEQHPDPRNDVSKLLDEAGYKVIFPREPGRPVMTQITGDDVFFVPKTPTT
jgi:FkbM family methyltransferase